MITFLHLTSSEIPVQQLCKELKNLLSQFVSSMQLCVIPDMQSNKSSVRVLIGYIHTAKDFIRIARSLQNTEFIKFCDIEVPGNLNSEPAISTEQKIIYSLRYNTARLYLRSPQSCPGRDREILYYHTRTDTRKSVDTIRQNDGYSWFLHHFHRIANYSEKPEYYWLLRSLFECQSSNDLYTIGCSGYTTDRLLAETTDYSTIRNSLPLPEQPYDIPSVTQTLLNDREYKKVSDRLHTIPDFQTNAKIITDLAMYSETNMLSGYYFTSDIIKDECIKYDTVVRKGLLCMQPIQRLCKSLLFYGWCENMGYILQKPVSNIGQLLRAAGSSCIIFICSDYSMLRWLTRNEVALKSATNVVKIILYTDIATPNNSNKADKQEVENILKSTFPDIQLFNGRNCCTSTCEDSKLSLQLNLDTSQVDLEDIIQQLPHNSNIDEKRALLNLLTQRTATELLQNDHSLFVLRYYLSQALNATSPSGTDLLKSTVGQTKLKQYLQDVTATYKYEKIRGNDINPLKCVALVGNSGAGKTLFSQVIAELIHENGITTDETTTYTIYNASSLIGPYQGTTSAKVREIFSDNKGSTIIIEGLSVLLNHCDYGRQALIEIFYQASTLIDTALIITDDEEGFTSLLSQYKEIESIFDIIHLDDYNVNELTDIYIWYLQDTYNYLQINRDNVHSIICKNLQTITGDINSTGALVGNAKYVIQAAKETVANHAKRTEYKPDNHILQEDIAAGFQSMTEAYINGDSVCTDSYKFNTSTDTHFSDIIGNDTAIQSLKRLVDYKNNPAKYETVGAHFPHGILLEGPPGTGKTHMARALAAEAQMPFCYVSGSEFVQKYVGEGASRIRKLFKEARKRNSCIIFIDEIDAIGGSRSTYEDSNSKESDHTLNQLLIEMDGFLANKNIFILGATNLASKLDPALLRPGRFDEVITVNLPTVTERLKMLQQFTAKYFSITEQEMQNIADITIGCSGAQIKGIVEQAKLIAGQNATALSDNTLVTYKDLMQSATNTLIGYTQNSKYTSEEKKRVSCHEIGHTLITLLHKGIGSVQGVSILPRSNGSLGISWQHSEDKHVYTKSDLLHEIEILIAGMTAEKLVFGDVSTGSSEDLKRATNIARDMIIAYCMYPEMWLQSTNEISSSNLIKVEQKTNEILNQAHNNVYNLILQKRELFNMLVDILQKKEELQRSDIDNILKEYNLT